MSARLTAKAIGTIALATALAGVVYLGALDNPFVYDDYRLVVENHTLADLSNLRAIVWHDITRPVVNISYAVDYAIWGPGPFGFHLTNVLLHAVNVVLVGLLASRVAASRAALGTTVAVASLFFAVHPLLASAVGYVSGRSELLCATFFLTALLSADRWMAGGGRVWVVSVFAGWALALGSKEIAAMFPLVALIYDRWLRPTDAAAHRRRWLWLHAPMWALAVALVAARLFVFASIEHGGTVVVQWPFVLVESDVIRRYLGLLLVPSGQAIYHAVDPVTGLADPRAWLGVGAVAIHAGLAWRLRRRAPAVALGLVWFLLLLLPSSLLVVLDRGEPMAEHRVYVASIGMFIAVASLTGWLASRFEGRRVATMALGAALATAVLVLAGRTWMRNVVWSNATMVWLEAAEQAPDDWLPHLLLGEELHRAGQHDQAVAAYRRGIALGPQDDAAFGKLGTCLLELGDVDEAERAFLRLKSTTPQSVEAANGLATVALVRGRLDDARLGYLEAQRIDASSVAAAQGLALVEEKVREAAGGSDGHR